MAEIKTIIKRRKSATNIKKITKTMALIAAAKFKVATRRVHAIQPYTQRMNGLLADLMASDSQLQHPLTQEHSSQNKVALLVLTSQRGLCGAYNTRLLDAAEEAIKEIQDKGQELQLHVVGKKGVTFFNTYRKDLERKNYLNFSDNPSYAELKVIAEMFMEQYVTLKIDELKVVSMDFASASQQNAQVTTVLPFPLGEYNTSKSSADYTAHPNAKDIFEYVVPKNISANFFTLFLEAAASEHVQRMIAMNAATENASNMIKELTRKYNRARQAKITTELSEIMGAVRALKKG